MVARIGPVLGASAIGDVQRQRLPQRPNLPANTEAITVYAAGTALLTDPRGSPRRRSLPHAATEHFPAVVLGADAATALGIDRADGSCSCGSATSWFTVVGILDPLRSPPISTAPPSIGFPVAEQLLHAGAHRVRDLRPHRPHERRSGPGRAGRHRRPGRPAGCGHRQPRPTRSTARADASAAFQGLLLALGAVALVVGGIGIANVMVIAVLERRGEIGLRRALGAKRTHVATQFVAEASLLAALGGVAGVALGASATTVYAVGHHWNTVVSVPVLVAAVAVAVIVGAVAGLYPALRASRLSPSEALRAV